MSLVVLRAALAALAILISSAASASTITYAILSQGAGISLAGTITTDGHIGTLSVGDITAWQITATGVSGTGLMTSIDNTDSTVSLTGSALSASLTSLSLNFSSSIATILSFTSTQTFPSIWRNNASGIWPHLLRYWRALRRANQWQHL
jgi:hypothetical protein